MNIVLSEFYDTDLSFLKWLTGFSEVSMYLSVSQEDTLRLLRLIKPEVLIISKKGENESNVIKRLKDDFPGTGMYCYTKSSGNEVLEDIKNNECFPVEVMMKKIIKI
ncbi:MAG: hypothetical protein JXR56_02450 [Candidatus Cloacimonetes bacterium]|nr:hypothetical protein [Candidatus Cloacimonadota bacterium]